VCDGWSHGMIEANFVVEISTSIVSSSDTPVKISFDTTLERPMLPFKLIK
jgi:hypothetical protein